MKILFQGDSITDWGRDRSDPHNLGFGYPGYAAKYIREALPDEDIEFIDLGISGDQTANLVARLQSDFIDIGADVVSILIGINDTWHRADTRQYLDDGIFEQNYRTVLEAVKKTVNEETGDTTLEAGSFKDVTVSAKQKAKDTSTASAGSAGGKCHADSAQIP